MELGSQKEILNQQKEFCNSQSYRNNTGFVAGRPDPESGLAITSSETSGKPLHFAESQSPHTKMVTVKSVMPITGLLGGSNEIMDLNDTMQTKKPQEWLNIGITNMISKYSRHNLSRGS